MNETITRAGWVATDPELYIDATGAESATFRLAVPANRPDELTQWFTVKARHNLALNVAESIKKGQPVLVVGNMPHHTWSANTVTTEAIIEAAHIDHDLVRGTATFTHSNRDASTTTPPTSTQGDPS